MNLRLRRTLPSLALATVVAALPHPASAAAPVVLSQGHVDVVDIHLHGSAFELHVHDSTDPAGTGVERDPAEVLFAVRPEARTTVPADQQYRFLGKAGAPVWVLPQSQDSRLLFAGYSAHEVPTGKLRGDTVRLKLVKVSGPAEVSVFTVNATGKATVLLDSGDGLPDETAVSAGSHAHVNWGFEATGEYTLTFQAVATTTSGQQVSSAPTDFRFRVG